MVTSPRVLAACPATSIHSSSFVAKVIDGDSLVLADGDQVRIIGINTPERNMPLSRAAHRELRQTIKGQKVDLQYGKHPKKKGGRLFAHVYDARGQ